MDLTGRRARWNCGRIIMVTSVIPITAVPAQSFTVSLDGQDCAISIYQKSTGLYFDLISNGVQVVQTELCRDRVGLVMFPYLGFLGQLAFFDTQGTSDPTYDGLGTRFILAFAS